MNGCREGLQEGFRQHPGNRQKKEGDDELDQRFRDSGRSLWLSDALIIGKIMIVARRLSRVRLVSVTGIK
jgi:hypothetical protein